LDARERERERERERKQENDRAKVGRNKRNKIYVYMNNTRNTFYFTAFARDMDQKPGSALSTNLPS